MKECASNSARIFSNSFSGSDNTELSRGAMLRLYEDFLARWAL
jgi:hypothetical protein